MRTLTASEAKSCVLDILLALDKVCKEHDLQMTLNYGTLLGAVRHGGYIPWDDDIDVCMSRPDYERFRTLVKAGDLLPPHLKMICFEDGTFHLPYMKIVDTRTHVERKLIRGEEHLWIDIFPMDGLPADPKRAMKHCKRSFNNRRIIIWNYVKPESKPSGIKGLLRPLCVAYAKLYGVKRAQKHIEKLCQKYPYETAEYVGNVAFCVYFKGERIRKSEFEELTDISFEGHSLRTMSCYHDQLTRYYGDYMQLPPEDKRITHELQAKIED